MQFGITTIKPAVERVGLSDKPDYIRFFRAENVDLASESGSVITLTCAFALLGAHVVGQPIWKASCDVPRLPW